MDNGAHGIWVWIGKRATQKEREEALRNAQGFVSKKGYPAKYVFLMQRSKYSYYLVTLHHY